MEKNKVDQYLIDLMYSYREVEENLWILDEPKQDLEGVAIMYDDPLVIFRVVVMKAPRKNRLEFFTKLLELNATEITHGAYALEGDDVVLINTQDYATMDFTEFRSTLDSFGITLRQHYRILSPFRENEEAF